MKDNENESLFFLNHGSSSVHPSISSSSVNIAKKIIIYETPYIFVIKHL